MRRHHSRLLVAVLALSLLTACSVAKDTGAPGVAKTPQSTGGAGSPTKNETSTAVNGASNIGIDQPDLSKTIYSKQFALPGEPSRKVTVGILSLERRDRVAILKVVVTPEFADLPAGDELIGFQKAIGENDIFRWQPTLLDLKDLKKYNVLHSRGTGGAGMLVFDDGEDVNGRPTYGWAVFAAPPAAVTSIDVNVSDWMPRFTNVPIQ